jgi:RNA polymerase sigma factor (sigma-70 family)
MHQHPTAATAAASASEPLSLELLRRARAGDSQALNRLLGRYLPKLIRFAQHRVPDWARNGLDTGDFVQETILRTVRHIPSLEPTGDGALLRYLRRALSNRIHNQLRHGRRHPAPIALDESVQDLRPSPLDTAIARENGERYAAALRLLKPRDRTAIVGRIELGYTYEQLALVLGRPSGEAARVAVRRALLRLSDAMRRGS